MPLTEILNIIRTVAVVLLAVIAHEVAHGWVADRLGDPTARLAGRLTLNPFKHIDLMGSLVVPFALRMLGLMPLGWAKPVPINFSRLHSPRRDMVFVALAGPGSNLVLAVLFSLSLKIPLPSYVYQIIATFIVVNLVLAMFNLLPVPPLDGSRILMGLGPLSWVRSLSRLEPYGLIVVLVLLNLGALDFIWGAVLRIAMGLGVDIAVLL